MRNTINFLIGDSGGFLLNIRPGKFVNTELFNEAARTYQATGKYTQFKVDSIPHRQFRRRECDRRRNGFSLYQVLQYILEKDIYHQP